MTLPSRPHDSKPSAVSAKPVTTAGGPPNDLDLNASVKKLRPASQQTSLINRQRHACHSPSLPAHNTSSFCLHLLHNSLHQVHRTAAGAFTAACSRSAHAADATDLDKRQSFTFRGMGKGCVRLLYGLKVAAAVAGPYIDAAIPSSSDHHGASWTTHAMLSRL